MIHSVIHYRYLHGRIYSIEIKLVKVPMLIP